MKTEHNVFADVATLMDYYVAQSADLRMRHTAIWLEVKHYTWVMSFFIGAGALAVANVRETTESGYQVAAGLSFFGSIIALVAFFIIKRDFRYFSRAERRLLYLERSLGVMEHKEYLDDRLELASGKEFSVSDSSKDSLVQTKENWPIPKIRTLIQASFILYALYGSAQSYFILYHVI